MATVSGIVIATSGSASQGRRTFIDIQRELISPIDASDDTLMAIAGDSFRSAIRKLDRKGLWPWEIQDEDVAITSGNAYSTVQGTIKKPLAMHLLDASGGVRDERLTFIEYPRFIEKYSLSITGHPSMYTIPNLYETGQIRWYPSPSANDNARLTYYRRTPLPRNEQEVVEIPDGGAMEMYMAFAWEEFLKRLPSEQRPFPITIAMAASKMAFKEMSAMVNEPGDMSRLIQPRGYGGYY